MASLRMLSAQTAAPPCAAPLRPNAPRPRTQSQITPRPSLPQQNQLNQQQQRSHVCSSLPHDSPSLSPVSSSTAPSSTTYTTTSAFLLGRNATTTRSALRRTLKASRKRVDTTALGALLQCDLQLQGPLPTTNTNTSNPSTSNSTSLEHELYLLTKMLKQLSHEAAVTAPPPPRTQDQSPAAPSSSSSIMEAASSSQTSTPTRPARPVFNPAISCASLLPPTPLPEALQLQLPPSASGRLLVCQGSKCQAAGSMDTLRTASALVAGSPGLEVLPSKCLGKCKLGPVMRVTRPEGQAAAGTDPKGQMYTHVTAQLLGQALLQEFCL